MITMMTITGGRSSPEWDGISTSSTLTQALWRRHSLRWRKTCNLNNSHERERTWVISNHQCNCCNRQTDQETYLCSPPKKGDTNEHCFVCKSASKAIESGLIDVWKQWTYTAMKEEYLQVTTLVLWQIPPKNCSNKQPRNITEYPLSRQKAATKKWLYQKEQTPWVWDQGQHIIDFTRYDIIAL